MNKGAWSLESGTLIEPDGPSISEGNSIYFEGSLGGPRSLYRSRPVLWNLLEEIHRVEWKNIPIQLLPAILMGDPACRIDAAVGTESINYYY